MGLIIQTQGSARASSLKSGNTWLLKYNGCCDITSPAWGNATPPPACCEKGIFLHSLIPGICFWVLMFMTLRFGGYFTWTCLCFWTGTHMRRYWLVLTCMWSSFISRLFVWWKECDTAPCVVNEWGELSFLLALKIIALLELLPVSSQICQACLLD